MKSMSLYTTSISLFTQIPNGFKSLFNDIKSLFSLLGKKGHPDVTPKVSINIVNMNAVSDTDIFKDVNALVTFPAWPHFFSVFHRVGCMFFLAQ